MDQVASKGTRLSNSKRPLALRVCVLLQQPKGVIQKALPADRTVEGLADAAATNAPVGAMKVLTHVSPSSMISKVP